MKTFLLVASLLLIGCLLTGCLFAHVKKPYDTDVDKTELGSKVGEATCRSVLWLVAWGDAGAAAAAKDGDLKVINHMDSEVLWILLGLYFQHTTIVYGD